MLVPMKQQNGFDKYKMAIIDWLFKALIAVIMFIVKDMRDDIKKLTLTVPGLQAKVDMLTDQQLLERFRRLPLKNEDEITFDSLTSKYKYHEPD